MVGSSGLELAEQEWFGFHIGPARHLCLYRSSCLSLPHTPITLWQAPADSPGWEGAAFPTHPGAASSPTLSQSSCLRV